LRLRGRSSASIEGEKEVIEKALAELVRQSLDFIEFPYNKIRVRKDFPKLLALIKVSAYLHSHRINSW